METVMDTLEAGRRDALRRLVDDGVLTAEQEQAVEAALADTGTAPRRGGWLVEIGGYIGGLLMLSGAGVVVANSWEHLGRGARIWLLAGFALVFALAGVLAAGGPTGIGRRVREGSPVRRRIVGLLFGLAAVPAAGAVGIGLDRYSWSVGWTVGLAVAVAGLVLVRSVANLVVTVAMTLGLIIAVEQQILHPSELTGTLTIVGLGLAWATVAVLRWVPARQVALALGTAIALIAAQFVEPGRTWSYAVSLGIGLACFAAYPKVRSVVLLVAAVIGVTEGITRAVYELASGTLSQAVVLASGGAALVAASLLGLRLSRRPQR
jgi:Predicted membrane protein (DUF2157)